MPKRVPRWIWYNRGIVWHVIIVLLLTLALWSVLHVAQTNKSNSQNARLVFCNELNRLKIINRGELQKDIDDLHHQVSDSLNFLKKHPQGTADFSRDLIVDNINQLKRRRSRKIATKKTLIVRNCVKFSKNPTGRAK